MSEPLPLLGCRPSPVASYLKALGVLRLVVEQGADPAARGAWIGESFVLETQLGREGLLQFLLRDYRPTPIVSPWNGGSGFYFREGKEKEKDPETGKRKKTGVRDEPTEATRTLGAIEQSEAARLVPYRTAIQFVRALLRRCNLDQAPKGPAKDALVRQIRSELPEEGLAWFDASVAITSDRTRYPALLGSGGNDGNLDFSSTFMQRLAQLIDLRTGEPTALAARQIEGSLFSDPAVGLGSGGISQFAPGAVGGYNAGSGFEGASLLNAWDLVLALEGALLFASAATRRLTGGSAAEASLPFTADVVAAGSGIADVTDETPARSEIWLPIWSGFAGYREIRMLLAEGRATIGRRAAADGLDFARAVAKLAVDRGIDAFERHAFLQRHGKMYISAPAGRIQVRRNPRADLIDDLERGQWLAHLRRLARGAITDPPVRLVKLAQRLDESLFDLTQRNTPEAVQGVLIAVGEAARYLSTSPAARGRVGPPPPLPRQWITDARDGSPEFEIAAALASVGARPEPGIRGSDAPAQEAASTPNRVWLPMAAHFVPLDETKLGNRDARPQRSFAWVDASALAVWGPGTLIDNLTGVLARRLIEQKRRGLADKPLDGALYAGLGAVSAFLSGTVDDSRIASLLAGLVWVDFGVRRRESEMPLAWETAGEDGPIPLAYAALKPVFTPDRRLRQGRLLAEAGRMPVPPGTVERLAGGSHHQVAAALAAALGRVRASGWAPLAARLDVPPIEARRLAAALLIPVSRSAVRRLAKRAYELPAQNEDEEGERVDAA